MDLATLILEKREGIARLTMNRPEKRNALSAELLRDLNTALDDVEADHEVRAVILAANGPSFSSGFDLTPGREHTEGAPTAAWDASQAAPRTLLRFWYLRQPTIAAVNGHAIGIGLTIALQADIRIVAGDAKYGVVQVRRGVIPDCMSHWTLTQLTTLGVAADILLTGRT